MPFFKKRSPAGASHSSSNGKSESGTVDLEIILNRQDSIERDYQIAYDNFKVLIPDDFNFAFDVIDVRGSDHDKTALLYVNENEGSKTEVSYSELSKRSSQFAHALQALGLKRGDFAAVVIGRIPEWYSVLFGCMKAGVISMPGTNLLTAKDIAYRVNQSKARAVIVTPEHCNKVDEIKNGCPTLEILIVIGDARDGWHGYYDICAEKDEVFDRSLNGGTASSDMMMAYFTSGTTALPKLVPRTYGYGLAHIATALFWNDLSQTDIHWTLTDTGWAKAAWGLLFPPLLIGATVVLYEAEGGFDAERHLQLIGELGVTTFCAPPTIYRLFAQMDLSGFDLTGLRRCIGAGEPLNPEVIRYWRDVTGTTIADGYGQTETINIVGNFPGVEIRHGSMGKPVPGFDVDVVDDDGNRVGVGEVGNIAINTERPQEDWPPGLFHGYFTETGIDTSSFRHGWYYTGDTATKDKDGYLWFVGRADDLISSAGYRISPFEVESSLLEHPAVAESAVIGVPDETRGQLVMAYIVLGQGFEPSEALKVEIQDFCKTHTAPYKYPRVIEFRSDLPKTISGKIRRVELRAETH